MIDRISENVSEKRGRPRRYDSEWVAKIRTLYPEVRTERGIRNKCYLLDAVRALKPDDDDIPREYSWLWNDDRIRETILYALGRQNWDAESVRLVARSICRDKMRTREAIEFIELVKVIAKQDADPGVAP